MTDQQTGHILTVSKLTHQIKTLLEDTYPFVWVIGEISNFSTPASGHSYFTLKDDRAVISAVIFRNQKRSLKFQPENGLTVFGLARLSLYEPRGSYQLIFEYLEPEGTGSAQIAFEQLKNRLTEKGYFDSQHKKQIPFLPDMVSIITSGTGAAVRDILHIAQRRYPNCRIDIVPVQVQGDDSIQQICNAIAYVNEKRPVSVIILARGGGSLEDLLAFNSEPVAEAIFGSKIPIVTGIGHETDYTIADFTADLRAPTPSAAAELVFPEKRNLVFTINSLTQRLNQIKNKKFVQYKQHVLDLSNRLKTPNRLIDDNRFKIEDLETRLNQCMNKTLHYYIEKIRWLTDSLMNYHPRKNIIHLKSMVNGFIFDLTQNIKNQYHVNTLIHNQLRSKLDSLNPQAVLQRGYSISRRLDNHKIITSSTIVQKNDLIEILLHKGRLITKVEKIHDKEKNI